MLDQDTPVFPKCRRMRTIHPVVVEVAKAFGITPTKLLFGGKFRVYSRPRQVAMYVLHETMSYPAVARELRLKDHTTCIFGVDKVWESPELLAKAREILAQVRSVSVRCGASAWRPRASRAFTVPVGAPMAMIAT